jgi:hypothetical protein
MMKKETKTIKGLTLDGKFLSNLNKRLTSEVQSPIPALTTRTRYLGVNIRHPYICKRCRRFKLQGFYGSFPPKNFCICSSDHSSSFSISPVPIRLPSKSLNHFIATGTALQGKVQETSESTTKDLILPKFTHSKDLLIETSKQEPVKNFKFLVFPGNNSKLIKKIILQNTDWIEGNSLNLFEANFIWQPFLKNMIFRKLGAGTSPQILNHFEYHSEISNKFSLFRNLSSHCEANDIELTQIVPATFVIDLKSKKLNSQLNTFVHFFRSLINKDMKNKPELPLTHFTGSNVWLIKPSDNNRGRGIQIFNSLAGFKSLMSEFISGKAMKKSRRGTYIVQKYIESPLLISSRKFDIRVWVLVTSPLKCFIYEQGYIRTSSNQFSLEDSSLTDVFIHLTNNAVQKESKEYSKFEKGNQMSFHDFESFFQDVPGFDFGRILKEIKEQLKVCLQSCLKKINPNGRTGCFEIFGFDFIVDSAFKPWLIECNTNPCIELSSPLLEKLIPEMLKEALSLTVPGFPVCSSKKWLELLN